jgi:hypothetical protein
MPRTGLNDIVAFLAVARERSFPRPPRNSVSHTQEHLRTFKDILQADGYGGFTGVWRPPYYPGHAGVELDNSSCACLSGELPAKRTALPRSPCWIMKSASLSGSSAAVVSTCRIRCSIASNRFSTVANLGAVQEHRQPSGRCRAAGRKFLCDDPHCLDSGLFRVSERH